MPIVTTEYFYLSYFSPWRLERLSNKFLHYSPEDHAIYGYSICDIVDDYLINYNCSKVYERIKLYNYKTIFFNKMYHIKRELYDYEIYNWFYVCDLNDTFEENIIWNDVKGIFIPFRRSIRTHKMKKTELIKKYKKSKKIHINKKR